MSNGAVAQSAETVRAAGPRFSGMVRRLAASRAAQLLVALLVEGILFARASPYFFTPANLLTILQNSADLAIISVGMAVVLTLGGIDVSVGSVEGIAAIVVGRAIEAQWGLAAALLGPLAGALLGLVNGIIIVYGRVPAIIATLGTMNLWRAGIFGLVAGRWISGLPDVLAPFITGTVLGMPALGVILASVYLIGWYLMRASPIGAHVHAIGSSEKAATYAGVPVRRTALFAYVFVGLLTGLAGTLYVARYQNVEINVGTSIALDAIAAGVLGGTSVMGGEFNLLGVAIGVAFVVVLRNGLVILNIPSLWEQVVVGGLLIVVVVVDFLQHRLLQQRMAR